jgi:hypothetical protein
MRPTFDLTVGGDVAFASGLSRHISPTVRTFIDHLHARMTPPPWEIN